jgi:RecB family exonuclease
MHAVMQKLFQLIAERQAAEQSSLFASAAKTEKAIGEIVSENEIDEIYAASWVDEWYSSPADKEAYRAKGKKLLREYWRSIKDEHVHPLHLEKKFTLKVGDATLRGAIDRIDLLPDGSVRIIDYKTGNPKTDDDVGFEEKQQLLIYQIAALDVLGIKPATLTFVFLENGSTVEFLGTDKELDKMREYVTRAVWQIKNSDFSPTASPYKCRNCDFKDICEFRIL